MKVILQKDISNLGEAGDIINVANGYARNYLIPQKLVIIANESSKKAVLHQQKIIKIKKIKRKRDSEKIAEKLSDVNIQIDALVGEEGKLFGSITSIDIAKKLKEKGIDIDKRKILLDDPIKQIGKFDIPVKLDEGLIANLVLTVDKRE